MYKKVEWGRGRSEEMVGEDGEMTMMSGDRVSRGGCGFRYKYGVLRYYQGIMQRDGQYLQSIGSNNMHYNRSTAICSRSGCREWKKEMHRIFPCREPKPDVIVI